MANLVYNDAKAKIADGTIDWDTSVVKIMLVSGYTADDAHTSMTTSVTPSEVSGTGYTAGGATLTTSVVLDQTNNQAELDATDVVWSTATLSATGAVVYSGDIPICWIDFGATKTSSAGDFTVQFHADGVLKLA